MRPAWTWILIDKYNRLLMLKRSNYTIAFPHYWTLPAGRWEAWENHKEIVVREVKEETGLDFIPTKLYHEAENENSWEMTHVHRFLWTYSGEIKIQEEEVDGYAWYTYEETKTLKIAFDYAEVIELLHKDGLLK